MGILDQINKDKANAKSMESSNNNNNNANQQSKTANPLEVKTPPPPLVDQTRPLITKTTGGADVVDTRNPPSDLKQDGNEIMTTDVVNSSQASQITELPKSNEYLYSCPLAEGFSIHLASGEVRAKEGLMKLNREQHEEIQALMRTGRPDIAQNAVLLDVETAEKVAREYLTRQKAAAHRGASNAENANFREIKQEPDRIPGQGPAQANAQSGRAENVLYNGTKVIEEGAFHADDSALNNDKV